jgi:hypothetical protein
MYGTGASSTNHGTGRAASCGRTATLSQRAPVARRIANVSENGADERACNAPDAS